MANLSTTECIFRLGRVITSRRIEKLIQKELPALDLSPALLPFSLSTPFTLSEFNQIEAFRDISYIKFSFNHSFIYKHDTVIRATMRHNNNAIIYKKKKVLLCELPLNCSIAVLMN